MPFGREDEAGLRRLSPSALGLLMTCGEAFRRKYIERERGRPTTGILAAKGTAVHRTFEIDLEYKRDAGSLLGDEDLRDLAADSWDLVASEEEIVLDQSECARGKAAVFGEAKDNAVALSELHHLEIAPDLAPLLLEERIEVELEGYPFSLMGYLDVIETDNSIHDTKTTGKTPSPDTVNQSIQGEVYPFIREVASGQRVPEFALDFLIGTKTPKAVVQTMTPPAEHDALYQRLDRAARVIETEAFLPADPGHWKCSERYCEYWETCPWGKRKRVQV